jgi:hypothetical protein
VKILGGSLPKEKREAGKDFVDLPRGDRQQKVPDHTCKIEEKTQTNNKQIILEYSTWPAHVEYPPSSNFFTIAYRF